MNIFKTLFNSIGYIFFKDKKSYISLVINGYTNPTIKYYHSVGLQIRESLRILFATLIVIGLLIFLLNKGIYFHLGINISNLVSTPRFFLVILAQNVLIAIVFSTIGVLIYLGLFKAKVDQVIRTYITLFFYSFQVYTLIGVPLAVLADFLFIERLLYGRSEIFPQNLFEGFLLICLTWALVALFWWFIIRPLSIFYSSAGKECGGRKLYKVFSLIQTWVEKALVWSIRRTAIAALIVYFLVAFCVPKVVKPLLSGGMFTNDHAIQKQLDNSPYVHG